MKRWITAIVALIVGAALATLVVLFIVQPWHTEESNEVMPVIVQPTAEPQPAFHPWEVPGLAQQQVANLSFPEGTNWVKCVNATFRPGNGFWVVTCEYYVGQSGQSAAVRTFLLDDETGKLQLTIPER